MTAEGHRRLLRGLRPSRAESEDLLDGTGSGPLHELLAAIEEFQCDYGMPVTGDMDDTTRAKLMEVYGC